MSGRRSAHSRRQASVDFPRYPPQNSNTQQPQQDAQQIPASDYESDNQGYVSDYPTKPPPANRTNEELNLSSLQRHNAEIANILSIAPYAVIYEFSPLPEPTWSKSGIEGTLFICQLTAGLYGEERYTAIVLNRRGLENYQGELRDSEHGGVEISDQFVIISNREGHEQKIHGVFIFSEGEGTSTAQSRAANAELMRELSRAAGSSRKAGEAAAAQATARHTNGHIQEAGETVDEATSPHQQMSLHQMFQQGRAEDAGFSVRAHNLEGSHVGQISQPHLQPSQGAAPSQNDVLGDLFRRAGLR